MNLDEFHTFDIKDAVKFHKELNPKIFNLDAKMDDEVREQLLIIAEDFITELGIKKLDIDDITISGSNAAYSYTDHSDLDLHILVDFSKLPDDEVYRELFTAKKTIYNDMHDITVRNIPVELYVQDSQQPHYSLGEYSVLKDKWLRMPTKRRANFDQRETKVKYDKLMDLITIALKSKDIDIINKTLDILKRYRKSGLEKAGEFGPENLAFKAIRKQGLFQKLWDLKNNLHSKKLSIEGEMDEDWHPNAKPPGPEFPPTMPMGTIRVDVSDVYDWYKLGQHISNMKGLGKHDFGKGPPSTILSFGDEDLEHQYIDALSKTGLDVTDIDPKGHEPKKGIKTDPTYNVNENIDYMAGHCHVMALALKQLYPDWKIRAHIGWEEESEDDEDYRVDHVYIVAPDGSAYDCRGKFSNEQELVGPDETGGVETQFVNYSLANLKADVKRGELKKFTKDDILKALEFVKRININVNEILDKESAAKVYWSKENYMTDAPVSQMYTTYTAAAQDKNKNILKYNFYDFPKHDLTAIEFSRAVGPWGANFSIDNAGDQYTVFATLIKTIEEYLSKHKPKYIMFGAKEPSRAKLYQTFVNRFASKFGYKQISPDSIPKPVSSMILSSGDTPFLLQKVGSVKEASGYIPTKKEKNDPRFKTALTVDVKPDSIIKNANAFGFKTSRAGIPPTLRANGKIN